MTAGHLAIAHLAIPGPPFMLALTVVTLIAIRARSLRARLVIEALLMAALAGCFALWRASLLEPNSASQHHDDLWLRALAVIWWLIGARLIASFMVVALGRDARSRQARLLSDLVAGAIYLTAALVVLNSVLGLHVKGLLATSGVIAVLLGLAAQNTLSDVFSGIAMGLDQPFRVGDRVSIGDLAEGVVVQTNWRAVRVRTDGDDVALIPNSIVAKSPITNHSAPTARRAAAVDIPVASSARSETLIELLRQAILLSPALLAEPAPTVSLKHVGARTTTFTIGYAVASSGELTAARGQLLRQVRRLFRHAGVGGEPPPSLGALLAGSTLFDSLSAEQIAGVEGKLMLRKLDPQDRLFEQGATGSSLYIVRVGVLEIGRQDGEGWSAVGRVGPGEYIGEISMMTGEPHPVTAVALSACEVAELPRAAAEVLLSADPALGEALERSVRKGMALLDRDDGARLANPLDATGSRFGKIRRFLHRKLVLPGASTPAP